MPLTLQSKNFRLRPKDAKRFRKLFNLIPNFGEARFFDILAIEADKTVKRMKKESPKDTLRLEKAITAYTFSDTLTFVSSAIDPESGDDYAPTQELGNPARNIKAQPYFYHNIKIYNNSVKKKVGFELKGLTTKPQLSKREYWRLLPKHQQTTKLRNAIFGS